MARIPNDDYIMDITFLRSFEDNADHTDRKSSSRSQKCHDEQQSPRVRGLASGSKRGRMFGFHLYDEPRDGASGRGSSRTTSWGQDFLRSQELRRTQRHGHRLARIATGKGFRFPESQRLTYMRMRTIVQRLRSVPTGLLLLCCACASTPEADKKGIAPPTPPPISRTLNDIDQFLLTWNHSVLADPTEQYAKQISAAERAIQLTVAERFDEFTREMDSGPYRNRLISTAALGFSKDARALPYLLRSLNDPDPQIACNALISLGVLASQETPTQPLIEALEHHPQAEVRNNAAFTLKKLIQAGLRTDEMRNALRNALRDPEAGVRAQAAAGIGELRDLESFDSLLALLGDSKPLISTAAAHALGKLKDDRAKDALIASLESSSPRVREAAHQALVAITGEDRGMNAWDWKK